MREKIAQLVDRARALESRLSTRIDRAAQDAAGAAPLQPLEIVHRVVALAESEIQPAGRGRRTFPFNQLRVSFAAPTPQARARLQALCDGPPSLHERIAERLRAGGCSADHVALRTAVVTRPRPAWTHPEFHVEFARVAEAPGGDATAAAVLELTVTHGDAAETVHTFATTPVTIGRGVEVRDRQHRLLRTNHVAFTEGAGEATQSVSRRHAQIIADRRPGTYRIVDDGSAQGTTVIRRGRGIPVPAGSRGITLQSGDEIAVGQARIQVRVLELREPV